MKVWVCEFACRDGHYHLISNCEAIRDYPKEHYKKIDWRVAYSYGCVPCPICHDKKLEIKEVVK